MYMYMQFHKAQTTKPYQSNNNDKKNPLISSYVTNQIIYLLILLLLQRWVLIERNNITSLPPRKNHLLVTVYHYKQLHEMTAPHYSRFKMELYNSNAMRTSVSLVNCLQFACDKRGSDLLLPLINLHFLEGTIYQHFWLQTRIILLKIVKHL